MISSNEKDMFSVELPMKKRINFHEINFHDHKINPMYFLFNLEKKKNQNVPKESDINA